MNLFQKIFGYRSKLSASSSLTYPEALDIAQMVCERMKTDGRDVEWRTIQNTNSMLPTLDSNAIIILEKVDFKLLGEGDVVTYLASFNKGVNIHRLNERRGENWWPLGDNNSTMDPELVTPGNFDRRLVMVIHAKKSAETDR